MFLLRILFFYGQKPGDKLRLRVPPHKHWMQTTSPEPSGSLGHVLTDMLLAIWLATICNSVWTLLTSAAASLHMVLLINITAIPSLRLQLLTNIPATAS